ncbi:MAG TPA: PDZ domain-containing protein [Methylotenera sp.]
MRNQEHYSVKTLAISQAATNKSQLKKIIVTGFLSLSMVLFVFINTAQAAEENPYAKNYKEQNTYKLKSLNANPDTKLFVSNHKDDDNISMLEDGYDMIGSSGFSATEASPDLALQHAKSIMADTVLIYKKYESAKTASSQLQLVKEAAKKGEDIDPNDLVEEPTVHYFYASYWAKLPMPLLGVHIIKLKKNSDESTDEVQALPGLKIIAVIKESPAAKAGIARGDTVLKIGDMALAEADDLFAAVKKYAGQTVDVELERKGVPTKVSVAINSRK